MSSGRSELAVAEQVERDHAVAALGELLRERLVHALAAAADPCRSTTIGTIAVFGVRERCLRGPCAETVIVRQLITQPSLHVERFAYSTSDSCTYRWGDSC